jgi:hypothetical protein
MALPADPTVSNQSTWCCWYSFQKRWGIYIASSDFAPFLAYLPYFEKIK